MSYIEEHCLIFDNEEENKLEYTTIHMVSTALLYCQKSSHLKDPGLNKLSSLRRKFVSKKY